MNALTKSASKFEHIRNDKSVAKTIHSQVVPTIYKDADCQSTEEFELAKRYPSTLSPLITINDADEGEDLPINSVPDQTPNSNAQDEVDFTAYRMPRILIKSKLGTKTSFDIQKPIALTRRYYAN